MHGNTSQRYHKLDIYGTSIHLVLHGITGQCLQQGLRASGLGANWSPPGLAFWLLELFPGHILHWSCFAPLVFLHGWNLSLNFDNASGYPIHTGKFHHSFSESCTEGDVALRLKKIPHPLESLQKIGISFIVTLISLSSLLALGIIMDSLIPWSTS